MRNMVLVKCFVLLALKKYKALEKDNSKRMIMKEMQDGQVGTALSWLGSCSPNWSQWSKSWSFSCYFLTLTAITWRINVISV